MKAIGIYHDYHWITTVKFKWRWQATLFHLLLNASKSGHAGTKEG